MPEKYDPLQVMAMVRQTDSKAEAARQLGMPVSTLKDIVARYEKSAQPLQYENEYIPLPQPGSVTRLILSSAQSGTEVDTRFVKNLEAYAKFLNARIIISGYNYAKVSEDDEDDFPESIEPYIDYNITRFNLADKLIFFSEICPTPTNQRPLTSLKTISHEKWAIVPHPRISLESVATRANDPAKMVMTTGSVTYPNYLSKVSGKRAEFHHIMGAVLVELDSDGDLFTRFLIADRTGMFYDLDRKVENETVTVGNRVESIVWGDIHHEALDWTVAEASWFGPYNILDTLKPVHQFFHDVIDFGARSHHNIRNHHKMFEFYVKGEESLEETFKKAANFLWSTKREFCRSIVVASNHDDHLRRWLVENDYKKDPVNAVFYLETESELYRRIKENPNEEFNIFEWNMKRYEKEIEDITFLKEDESFVLNKVEYGLHGHRGANGSRGNFRSFTRIGTKTTIAHTHSANIEEGVYQVGTSSKLNMGYNRGPSSWNHTHVIMYPNGKRTTVTLQGNKWQVPV